MRISVPENRGHDDVAMGLALAVLPLMRDDAGWYGGALGTPPAQADPAASAGRRLLGCGGGGAGGSVESGVVNGFEGVALPLGNGQALLGPRGSMMVEAALQHVAAARLRAGARPSSGFAELLSAMSMAAAEARVTLNGSAVGTSEPAPAAWVHRRRCLDPVTSREAARWRECRRG